MLKKSVKTKIHLYSFITLALTFCLILTVAASLSFSPKTSVQDQSEESNIPDAAALSDNLISDTSVNGTDEQTQNATQENVSLITQEQALNIAMPIFEQYASEHNRTVISVNAELSSRQAATGTRVSLFELSKQNLSFEDFKSKLSVYPVWNIVAHFNVEGPFYYSLPGPDGEITTWQGHVPDGYAVSMWADNGEIFYSSPEPLTC